MVLGKLLFEPADCLSRHQIVDRIHGGGKQHSVAAKTGLIA